MTGFNFADRRDFQPEFWPSAWQYEQQFRFGAIDAPDNSPAGGMERYEGEYVTLHVPLVTARGM